MNNAHHSIENSYERITPRFYWISRLIEKNARVKALELSGLKDGDAALIIAPPTEFFLDTLLARNPEGENHLMYLSASMKNIAEKRLKRGQSYVASIGQPETLPCRDDSIDVVFAFCYLDFMKDPERAPALAEIRRVLKERGRLLTTYLATPDTVVEKLSISLLRLSDYLSRGIMVVEAEPALIRTGFRKVRVFRYPQKGVPVALAYAEK